MYLRLKKLVIFLVMLGTTPAWAQQGEPREIAATPTEGWRHGPTGMALPPNVGGLSRSQISDANGDGQDIVITYLDRGEGMIALVYIYRTMTPNVPIWFDRALAQIVPPSTQDAPAISGFTRPGASTASGLRAAMNDNVPGIRSTAIAMAPMGQWLVKVRLGSRSLDPAALAERLDAFVAALAWPAEAAGARVATPVEACRTALRLRQARIVRASMEDIIMDSALASIEPEDDVGPPAIYCREPGADSERGVYRPNEATDTYLIAMRDAGIALRLGDASGLAALLGNSSGRRRFSMTLLERNSSSTLPSFDRLPPPDQALAVARSSQPTTTTTVGD